MYTYICGSFYVSTENTALRKGPQEQRSLFTDVPTVLTAMPGRELALDK